MSNNIFVIGGSGFVGTSLQNIFKKNNYSFCIGDKKIFEDSEKEVFIDVTKPKTLDKLEGYDVIINLAAEHRDDVVPISRYDQVNVRGAEKIYAILQENMRLIKLFLQVPSLFMVIQKLKHLNKAILIFLMITEGLNMKLNKSI